MESGFLLDVVVAYCSLVLEALACEDKSLLIGWDALFVLDLSFDSFNGVGWFNIKSNGLSSEGFDKYLHSTFETENQMESCILLNTAVANYSSILKVFPC
jgi:hypothetical protein